MKLSGHLYLVHAANGRSTAKRLEGLGERFARALDPNELIVSARDEETALRLAKVIQQAGRARELVTEREAAFREGYRHALGELRIQVAKLRNEQPSRPTAQYAGVTDGREDMLDTIERWSLSVAPTERP